MPGSSSSTDRIRVGWLGRPHGVRGEVVLVEDTDYQYRFVAGARFVLESEPEREIELTSTRIHNRKLLATFAGIDNRTDAEALRGAALTIPPQARRPLDEDEYWPESLVGLEVRDPAGRPLGSVESVEVGGAQDRLVVRTARNERAEVPFVRELVPEVRVESGYLVVVPLGGLLSPSPG